MPCEVDRLSISFSARFTYVSLFVCMNPLMLNNLRRLSKHVIAYLASVRLLSSVRPLVDDKVSPSPLLETFLALTALVLPISAVQPFVAGKGYQVRETLREFFALERPLAGMNSHMSDEPARLRFKFCRIFRTWRASLQCAPACV